MAEIQTKEQTSWNILAKRAEMLSQLLWGATNAVINYKWERAFANLSGLRELIDCDLKSQTQEELNLLEKQMRNIIASKVSSKETINTLASQVRTYQRKLMACLKNQGYFPIKSDERFLGAK